MKLALNEFYLMDCMDGMAQFPDKFFELSIVDPPYGGGNHAMNSHRSVLVKDSTSTGGFFSVERTGGKWAAKYGKDINKWDIAPPPEYFAELFRVSQNVIIWGGNYFDLPPSRNFIVWRKLTISETFSMAMAEYAWTNISGNAKVFEYAPQAAERFHPTQKPVALYRWLLRNYAKPGDKILDTHVGSASSLIACHEAGYDFVGFEIDHDYHAAASARLKQVRAQGTLFDMQELIASNVEHELFMERA